MSSVLPLVRDNKVVNEGLLCAPHRDNAGIRFVHLYLNIDKYNLILIFIFVLQGELIR